MEGSTLNGSKNIDPLFGMDPRTGRSLDSTQKMHLCVARDDNGAWVDNCGVSVSKLCKILCYAAWQVAFRRGASRNPGLLMNLMRRTSF